MQLGWATRYSYSRKYIHRSARFFFLEIQSAVGLAIVSPFKLLTITPTRELIKPLIVLDINFQPSLPLSIFLFLFFYGREFNYALQNAECPTNGAIAIFFLNFSRDTVADLCEKIQLVFRGFKIGKVAF